MLTYFILISKQCQFRNSTKAKTYLKNLNTNKDNCFLALFIIFWNIHQWIFTLALSTIYRDCITILQEGISCTKSILISKQCQFRNSTKAKTHLKIKKLNTSKDNCILASFVIFWNIHQRMFTLALSTIYKDCITILQEDISCTKPIYLISNIIILNFFLNIKSSNSPEYIAFPFKLMKSLLCVHNVICQWKNHFEIHFCAKWSRHKTFVCLMVPTNGIFLNQLATVFEKR